MAQLATERMSRPPFLDLVAASRTSSSTKLNALCLYDVSLQYSTLVAYIEVDVVQQALLPRFYVHTSSEAFVPRGLSTGGQTNFGYKLLVKNTRVSFLAPLVGQGDSQPKSCTSEEGSELECSTLS